MGSCEWCLIDTRERAVEEADDEGPAGKYALLVFLKALERIEIPETDKVNFERAVSEPSAANQSFVTHAVSCGVELTPGFWALYALMIIGTWDKGGSNHAKWLPDLRALQEQDSDEEMRSPQDVLWRAVAESLQILASARDQNTQRDLIHTVTTAAEQCRSLGDADTAYDLVAGVLMVRLPYGVDRRGVAERALKLAEAAGKPHQIAACTSDIALSLLAVAEVDDGLRLDAFDVVERSVELIGKLSKPFLTVLATEFCQLAGLHQWVRPLLLPLLFTVGDADTRRQLGEVIGSDSGHGESRRGRCTTGLPTCRV